MSDWNDEERQLVEWLADMNEDDALQLAKRMLLDDKVNPMRVMDLCRAAMDVLEFKVMIGGGQIDETVRAYTGADAFGVNAVEAVSLCRTWLEVA